MNDRVINNLIRIYGNVFGNYETGTLVTRIGNLMLVFSSNDVIDCYGLGYESYYELDRAVTTFLKDRDLKMFSPPSVPYSDSLNFECGNGKTELARTGPVFTLVISHTMTNDSGVVQIRPSLGFFDSLAEEMGEHLFFSLANEMLKNNVIYTNVFLNKSGDCVRDIDQYVIIFNIKDAISDIPAWDKLTSSNRTRVFYQQNNTEFLQYFLSKVNKSALCPIKT